MLGALAVLAIVIAGFLYMFGARKLATRLIVTTVMMVIALSLLLPWLKGMFQQFQGWQSGGLVLLFVLVFLLLFHRKLGRFLLTMVVVYLKASYRVGSRLVEFLIRFPPVLLPLPERLVVVLCSILLTQSLLIGLIILVQGKGIERNTLIYLSLPLVAVLVCGLLGKWRYRRQERKGLANV